MNVEQEDTVTIVVRATRHTSVRVWPDLLTVVCFALALRLVVVVLTRDTYDYDEFVVLLLSRDFSHGAVPYHDFMFFHPPGALVVYAAIEPLTRMWWPLARLVTLSVDCITVALVWRIGLVLFERRTALLAGMIYACSPLALISAVRVGQDPIVTMLGMAGLWLLLTSPSRRAAVLAGGCLGLAVWVKYPALIFLPVCLLAAPRRTLVVLTSSILTAVLAFSPFLVNAHALYLQSVTFQRMRWLMPADQRIETWLLYWLAVNPLAPIGAVRLRRPAWLLTGFGLGVLFLFTAQTYYHYFVPIAPFGALLSAPVLSRIPGLGVRLVGVVGLVLSIGWAAVIDLGGPSPLFITSARLSHIAPTVTLIRRSTHPRSTILADRYEYAYLSNRQALAHYFWNVGTVVNATYLERQLSSGSAVVLSYGASSGYPRAFINFLNARYQRVRTPANTIWLLKVQRK